ncbi:sulfatase [Streptacidiphilus sp. ASG 303]|uniref:sulfatase n=1 Tax=Streptacidiphilus sp. ASG 303 TaxID=2896847 RepID=UPI001E39357B|nr:sulfatase [Streptacidiphilus sp. ASG 303]MCD0484762.1 sulfatase [Streptacidiphilus sp. ASG 303]
MSLFTGSRRLTDAEKAAAEEGPAPDDAATDREDAAAGAATDGPDAPDAAAAAGGWRGRHPRAARAAARGTTALAAVLVLAALLLPDRLDRLTPGAFARIPVEGILGAAVLLLLPPRARRAAALLGGAVLGLLTVLDLLDMGFQSVLVRPFDPVLDWPLLGDGEDFLKDAVGRAGAIGALVGAVLLVLALVVLTALAVLRLSRVTARHSAATTRTTLVLGTVWITCAALGLQLAGAPVASVTAARHLEAHAVQLRASLADEREFAREAAVDPFRGTPPDRLLTGLRGKDVIFAFIESYGRTAVQDSLMAPQVDAALADGTRSLRAAGFSSRSAFLTSPTFGGGSWLAHSTFMSGLWVTNQQRYRTVTSSDRMSLTGAFRRTGAWRTVGIMPGVTRAWPEASFYGLDHVYDSRHMGYRGPKFSWSPVPDQYSLTAFQRLEHGRPHDRPLMSEVILTSSHTPWAPVPRTIGWDQVGDGSVYDAVRKEGSTPAEVWRSRTRVRTEYGRSIRYSVESLVSFVEKYGTDDTVLVFLGDHQPAPVVSGDGAGHDVPIAIVAHDPKVLDRMSGWGWQDGLRPGPTAPVWRMDTFRDRFLRTYSGKAAPR